MQDSLNSVPVTARHFNVWGLRTLNSINDMSMASVFLDVEKAFLTKWHVRLLYELCEINIFISLMKQG
jgi:hypothetical protein